jgi:branched-chain amino acid transport system permease protein
MKRMFVILVIWAFIASAGVSLQNNYLVSVATATAFLALWGQSWNVLGGLSGNISLGHSMFVAIPAYVTVLLFQRADVPPLLGALLGVVASIALASVIGAATLRLRGPYFSLATLSAAAVVLSLILHFEGLTGGSSGIAISFAKDAPAMLEFTNVRAYYLIAITLLAAVTLFLDMIKRSRLGYYIAVIKSSEETAAAAGIRVALVKVLAFCLSAALTALGGVFYVFFIGFADPNFLAGLTLSIKIALIAVVGGSGFLVGPIVGAIFYETTDAVANAYLGAAGGWDVMILGFSVVAIVMTDPRGLCFMGEHLWRAVRRQSAGRSAAGDT